MSASLKSLIHEFAKQFDLEADAAWDSPIEVTIDGVELTLAEYTRSGEDEVLIYANLGVVPEERELEVYRGLLEANVLWSGTADATIGVNSATREAIMAYRLPLERLDGEKLSVMVAHFLAIAELWRDFVVNAGEEDAPLGSGPLSESAPADAIRA